MTVARDTNPVRIRREAQGMLLIELAEALGRSAGFVSMMEGGYVPTQPERRRQVASVLETTPEVLWPQEYA